MKFSLGTHRSLQSIIKELMSGLKRLDFENNFESFEVGPITIPDQTEASGDYKIRNELDPAIPTGMIIKKQTGNALVTAGSTSWTSDYVYIRNHSTTIDAVVTVIFIK